jgi:hypothetical protein
VSQHPLKESFVERFQCEVSLKRELQQTLDNIFSTSRSQACLLLSIHINFIVKGLAICISFDGQVITRVPDNVGCTVFSDHSRYSCNRYHPGIPLPPLQCISSSTGTLVVQSQRVPQDPASFPSHAPQTSSSSSMDYCVFEVRGLEIGGVGKGDICV